VGLSPPVERTGGTGGDAGGAATGLGRGERANLRRAPMWGHPGVFGKLLRQSGSFLFPGPLWLVYE